MIFAIVLGGVAGILGFLPLVYSLTASKRVTNTSKFSYASILLLSLIASIAILGIAAALCISFARDLVLPFVSAEALVLVVSAVGFGVYTFVRK